jgi:antitoxin (DNA-binding transcriptional repressor) of toxin-antitoxin stability system
MNTIDAADAQRIFHELLNQAEKGECIRITRDGMLVAVLSPAGNTAIVKHREAIARLKAFRHGRQADGLIKEFRDEGRL